MHLTGAAHRWHKPMPQLVSRNHELVRIRIIVFCRARNAKCFVSACAPGVQVSGSEHTAHLLSALMPGVWLPQLTRDHKPLAALLFSPVPCTRRVQQATHTHPQAYCYRRPLRLSQQATGRQQPAHPSHGRRKGSEAACCCSSTSAAGSSCEAGRSESLQGF